MGFVDHFGRVLFDPKRTVRTGALATSGAELVNMNAFRTLGR